MNQLLVVFNLFSSGTEGGLCGPPSGGEVRFKYPDFTGHLEEGGRRSIIVHYGGPFRTHRAGVMVLIHLLTVRTLADTRPNLKMISSGNHINVLLSQAWFTNAQSRLLAAAIVYQRACWTQGKDILLGN